MDERKGATAVAVICFLVLLVVLLVRFIGSGRTAQQVQPWNFSAIQATCAGIRIQELDPSHAAVVFLYDLDNNTDADYQLGKGPNIVVMDRLNPGGALSPDEQASLAEAAFVPARNQTRITLQVVHPFNWPAQKDPAAEQDFNQLVAADVSRLAGFVLFDQSNRYQIELPGNWTSAE